ncbi:MAG: DUF4136 domain-containing protein [Marinobacter sp.]|nr:DUF4136 domain-containing protein [Marinobacter sp.]
MRIFFTLMTLIWLTGCASNVVIDYDTTAVFGNYSSWAFAPDQGDGFMSLDAARAESAITQQMNRKAMRQVERSDADLLVRYRVEDVERLEQTGVSYGFGMGRNNLGFGLATAPPVREVKEGKLIVELADRRTERVVWRGASQRHLTERQTPQNRRKLIDEVVAEMFSKYPPGL